MSNANTNTALYALIEYHSLADAAAWAADRLDILEYHSLAAELAPTERPSANTARPTARPTAF
jgi:hypothetical protein